MVSPELIRRYPFFSGLTDDELKVLSGAAKETEYEEGTHLCRRNDFLASFFLILEGDVDIMMDLTARDVVHDVSAQLTGSIETEDIIVSTVIPGEIFSWSALIPPFTATAAVRVASPCRLVEFDARKLLDEFESDPRLGYKMTQKLAQVIQDRLQDRRMELLSQFVNHNH